MADTGQDGAQQAAVESFISKWQGITASELSTRPGLTGIIDSGRVRERINQARLG